MKKLLLPIIMLLVGAGGGVAARVFLAPTSLEATPVQETCAPAVDEHGAPIEVAAVPPGGAETRTDREYARMNNQFVVPIVSDGQMTALMILSLSIEVVQGTREAIFSAEPRLRNSFLQVLFNHANIGGFDGTFTNSENMRLLRESLLIAAQKDVGPDVTDVLIIDIMRQDI